MNIKAIAGIILSCLSFTVFSKTTNPLCSQVVGGNLNVGNGTASNPYLICNSAQFSQIGTNPTRLSQSYSLGADINFSGVNFVMIGASNAPFQGNFNGNEYTLSSITLPGNGNNIAIFRYLLGAHVSNLHLNKILINGSVGTASGGLSGLAKNSTVNNVHIINLDMKASDRSGGLIGDAENCVISNSSTQGIMHPNFGSDASGGLLGLAANSKIVSVASHVNMVESDATAFGVSAIGGLVGQIYQSTLTDSYADGTIDFSAVTQISPQMLPHGIGGVIGIGSNLTVQNLYSSGKFIKITADNLGGAVGEYYGAPSGNVFWDTTVSGLTKSALGIGEPTCVLKQKAFWISQGFSAISWILEDGVYPKLFSEN